MKRAVMLGLCLLAFASLPARANIFSNWAVVLVAGDDHAHDGSIADVFDNARRDLARALPAIGFSPQNIIQFSVEPVTDAQETKIASIASGLWDLSKRAPGGCLIYFTSHGAFGGNGEQGGILTNRDIWTPDRFANAVNNACGSKPSVIVMSACFSGQFIPPLAAPNRIIFTAARPDRTSFGCGNDLKYTFFDQCFLQSLPQAGDFVGLADLTRQCVALRERQERVDLPSEPQVSVGNDVYFTLRWK